MDKVNIPCYLYIPPSTPIEQCVWGVRSVPCVDTSPHLLNAAYTQELLPELLLSTTFIMCQQMALLSRRTLSMASSRDLTLAIWGYRSGRPQTQSTRRHLAHLMVKCSRWPVVVTDTDSYCYFLQQVAACRT